MEIQLIKGNFKRKEGLSLIISLLELKIKFHENKISQESSEEDIKYRESKIKLLQSEISKLKNIQHEADDFINIESTIKIN
jgi:hypothetical protein